MTRRHFSMDAGKSGISTISLSSISSNHLPSALALPSAPRQRKSRFIIIIIGLIGIIILVLTVGRSWTTESRRIKVRNALQFAGVIDSDSKSCANPFAEYGRLTLEKDSSSWVPYDTECTFPSLLSPITASPNKNQLELPIPPQSTPLSKSLPWLQNKTVLLFGDQVEFIHVQDFCHLTGGQLGVIDEASVFSPARFSNGIDERFGHGHPEKGRPRVCWVERYNFMMVMVYHYGLLNRVEGEHSLLFEEEIFYPPVDVRERLQHIVVPLLKSLDRTPDLIEFTSGTDDLQHFGVVDNAARVPSNSDLDIDRLEWYSNRLTKALISLRRAYPTTPVLWRALYRESDTIPFNRITALDHLSRKVIKDVSSGNLNFSFHDKSNSQLPKRKPYRQIHQSNQFQDYQEVDSDLFLSRVNDRISGSVKTTFQEAKQQSLVMKPIRVNEWGTIMNGLPNEFGASTLWAEILLFEMKRLSPKPSNSFLNRLRREVD